MVRRRLDALRILLDEIEVDRAGADRLAHPEAVALVGVKAVEEAALHLLGQQRAVGAIPARGENHRLGAEARGCAVRKARLHADHGARLVRDELLGARVGHDLSAVLREDPAHEPQEVDASSLDAELAARGVIRILRGRGSVGNLQIVDQPVDDRARALGRHLHEHRIVPVLARLHDVLVGELGAVARLLHYLALVARARGDQGAGVELRVAADRRHLLDQDDALALGRRANGRRDAGRPAADDENVRRDVGRLSGAGLLQNRNGHERGGIPARRADGGGDRAKNAAGGERRARDRRHADAVRLGDRAGELLKGRRGHARRLALARDLHVGDPAAREGDGDRDLAAPTRSDALEGAVPDCGAGREAHCGGHGGRDGGEEELCAHDLDSFSAAPEGVSPTPCFVAPTIGRARPSVNRCLIESSREASERARLHPLDFKNLRSGKEAPRRPRLSRTGAVRLQKRRDRAEHERLAEAARSGAKRRNASIHRRMERIVRVLSTQ